MDCLALSLCVWVCAYEDKMNSFTLFFIDDRYNQTKANTNDIIYFIVLPLTLGPASSSSSCNSFLLLPALAFFFLVSPSFCIIHYEDRVTCFSASFIFIAKPLICLSGWLFTPLNLHPFIHQCHLLSPVCREIAPAFDTCLYLSLHSTRSLDWLSLLSSVKERHHNWQVSIDSLVQDKMCPFIWARMTLISLFLFLFLSRLINKHSSNLLIELIFLSINHTSHERESCDKRINSFVSPWVCVSEYQVAIYFALAVVDDA